MRARQPVVRFHSRPRLVTFPQRVNSHLAIKQSIMPCTSSILFWMLKLIKLVSTSTRYGGPRSVLCERKSEDETCVLDVS